MISVIITTRNRRKLLIERSLKSILNQTYRDFEVIIVDDNSEDNIYDVVMALKNPQITILRNLERRGLPFSRNLGADYAKGDYIVFLDDDNEFEPDFLERTTIHFSDFLVSGVSVGKNIIYPEGRVYQSPPQGNYFSMNDGFLIRKKAFQKIRYDEELTANEDVDFGLRFLKKFKVGKIDKPLMTVYGSAIFNKTSYSNYSDEHLEGLCKFWLKNQNEFDKENKRYYQKMVGRYFLIASGKMKWFRLGYWLEQKLKRYYQIWL